MCKKGDIILINSYSDHGKSLPRHSFIVVEDSGGTISGFSFDFIALVMSFAKTDEQFKRKLKYPGNLPIGAEEQTISGLESGGNNKNGYTKCEQFYFFNKDLLDYSMIGTLVDGVLDIIIEYINELIENGIEFEYLIDNLQ